MVSAASVLQNSDAKCHESECGTTQRGGSIRSGSGPNPKPGLFCGGQAGHHDFDPPPYFDDPSAGLFHVIFVLDP